MITNAGGSGSGTMSTAIALTNTSKYLSHIYRVHLFK
jgi:hypothetical protein